MFNQAIAFKLFLFLNVWEIKGGKEMGMKKGMKAESI